jgi:hypothetical protein
MRRWCYTSDRPSSHVARRINKLICTFLDSPEMHMTHTEEEGMEDIRGNGCRGVTGS